ncbi:MAG: NUDIX hydrolase [Kiloniellales bacterium]|nr:NUDIX hydrolase [Kiloniellales bacterium]MDJ0982615.1 NUDIX hydrolase [Kiloniellales bacterium]
MSDYPNRPLIGVGVVVFKGDRVLLVRRGKPPRDGQWSLPGGRQRLGETVRATAAREVAEEAGLTVEVKALLDVIDSMTRDADGALAYHYTLVDFLAEWRAGEAAAGGDAAEAVWADPDDLAPYDLWDETLRIIALARQAR